jgi:hypothetical protein
MTVHDLRAHMPDPADLPLEGGPRAERRDAERAGMALPVSWEHRELSAQAGELRDVSCTGLFLRPAGGTSRFRADDVVWGTLPIGGARRPFAARVRWRGWSLEHRCVGLGLELEPTSALSDAELRALRWPQDPTGRPRLRLVRRLGG